MPARHHNMPITLTAKMPRILADPRRACRDADPETFFAVGTGAIADIANERAVAICYRCPLDIRRACAAWAIEVGADGVWGATTERDRRRLSKLAAA